MENKELQKKSALQSSLFNLTQKESFYGSLIQEINIKYVSIIPTAAITYNVKNKQYEVYLNADFFLNMTNANRVAVLQHEILHFTNKHLFRLPFMKKDTSQQDRKLFNIGGDMAINQFIQDLPPGGVDVKDWKLDNGEPFPTFRSMEEYVELIKKESKEQKGKEEDKAQGKGEGTKGNVNEKLDQFKEFDQHMWDSLDEDTKNQMLAEAQKIIKRTMEKTSTDHSSLPDSIKDLLQEIDTLTNSINYKNILKNIIKRTVSFSDREDTWHKPNRKFGTYSQGSKVGCVPFLNFYVDTSGSISIVELNQFLKIMSGFLKAGSRSCNLALWHTNMYYKKKYKMGSELDKEVVESGGTDITQAIEDVKKTKPALGIILTDGYFEAVNFKPNTEILWIISVGGNANHPMKHVGKTILLEGLK